jgi:phosphonate transport system substrate-binding protein
MRHSRAARSRLSSGFERVSRRELLYGFAGLGAGIALTAEFNFGLTPVVLDGDTRLLLLLQRYLMRQLGKPITLFHRRPQRETVEMLLSGRLNAAWICDLAFVKNRDKLTALAVPVYHGQPLYQAYIIANEASPARNFDDLRSAQHAFSDPDTASGYLLTCWLLGLRQESPATFFRNFFFTYSHRNTIRAVASGLADSGSVEGYVWELMKQREPDLVNRTRIISRSEPLGFPPIAVLTASLERPEIQAMAAALSGMNSAGLGPEILSILDLDAFTTPPSGLYDEIAEKWRLVKGQELRPEK